MRRLFPLFVTGLMGLGVVGYSSDLTLTGLTKSEGRVRAFISVGNGSGSVTLALHEERGGLKLDAVDFKQCRVWLSEGGATRCLLLGSNSAESLPLLVGSEAIPAPASSRQSAASAPSRIHRADAEVGMSMGERAEAVSRADGAQVQSLNWETGMEVQAVGLGTEPANAAHRWTPGVQRPPTEEELFRARYGSAAWESESRLRFRARGR